MPPSASFSDYQPIRYLGRVPIYATTLLVAAYSLGMIVTTILASTRIDVSPLTFWSPAFFGNGWLWQVLTATFIDRPDFFFLFGMFFLYSAGTEVERYLGRVRFLKLYALFLVVPALVLGLWYLVGIPGGFATSRHVTIGCFIAFATFYPNVEYFGWVPLKYVAFACLAISALGYFPARDWPGLSALLAVCATAFGFVRHLQTGGSVEWENPFARWFRRKPKFRVMPAPASPRERPAERRREMPEDALESINPLLDKIAKSGLASLTETERARLEQARAALLKKDGGPV